MALRVPPVMQFCGRSVVAWAWLWAAGSAAQATPVEPPSSVQRIDEELQGNDGDPPSSAADEEATEELSAPPDPSSADELAKKLANPNAPVMFMRSLLDITTYRGSAPGAERWSFRYSFQPTIPFKFDAGNLILRPLVPIVFGEPFINDSGDVDQAVGIGNISLDAAFGRTFSNGLLLIGGANLTFPTATRSALRADWAVGPELVVGYVGKRGLIGALTGFVWGLPQDGKNQSVVGQYFYAYGLGHGWQIAAQPTWGYQRETGQLTFPIGVGVQKVASFGKKAQLVQLGVQIWGYAAQADLLGPIWQLRISIAPVVPVPWEN